MDASERRKLVRDAMKAPYLTRDQEHDLAMRMEALFEGLQGEIDVGGHALRIQASCGAVMTTAREGDFDAMIVKADLALYKAKEHGKNSWQLFETALDEEFRSRQLMKAELRNAIETNGLRVVYQPIIAMDSMRIASCEALCRWDHPELGSISPAIFRKRFRRPLNVMYPSASRTPRSPVTYQRLPSSSRNGDDPS